MPYIFFTSTAFFIIFAAAKFTDNEKNHHVAFILLGFAVLMFGISAMTDAVYPLRESEVFLRMLTGFSNPLIGVLIGMLFTCIIQSASAAVGILQTLAVTGAVSFHLALPVTMGIAIGASVPVLLSALGANTNGKRTALIYLLVDALGALFFGVVFYSLNAVLHFSFMDMTMTMTGVALMNTLFRVIIVLLLSPMTGLLEKLVTVLIKDDEKSVEELRDVERLEEREKQIIVLRFGLMGKEELTQKQVAEYLRCDQSLYSKYERGERVLPLEYAIRLAVFYKTSTDYLLGLTDERKPYPRKK